MTVSESGGRWGRSTETWLPPGADRADGGALSAVSCTGPRTCTAVGSYIDQATDGPAMSVSESAGRWARARTVNANPAGADPTQPFDLSSVTCPRAAAPAPATAPW